MPAMVILFLIVEIDILRKEHLLLFFLFNLNISIMRSLLIQRAACIPLS